MGCGSSVKYRQRPTSIGSNFWNATDKLYCHEGKGPQLENYMRYLGFDPTYDTNYVWIGQEFMNEALPENTRLEVKPLESDFSFAAPTGYACWIYDDDEQRNQHPSLEKYRKMLRIARLRKPRNQEASVMGFKIEFLLFEAFCALDTHGSSQKPLVDTPGNVIELARIFAVKLPEEPYIGHVLRKALRHYGKVAQRYWLSWSTAPSQKKTLKVKFKSLADFEDPKKYDSHMRNAGFSTELIVKSSNILDSHGKHHDPDCYSGEEIAFPATLVVNCEISFTFVKEVEFYRRLISHYRSLVENFEKKKDVAALRQARSPWFAFTDEKGATFYCVLSEYPASITWDRPPGAINKDLQRDQQVGSDYKRI